MRITTYEKGGNSLNPFIKLSIFLMIILCLFVIPVSAFEDDFNDKEIISDWNIITGTWSVLNASSILGADDYYAYNGNSATGTTKEMYRSVSGDYSYYEIDMKAYASLNLGGASKESFVFSSNGIINHSINLQVNYPTAAGTYAMITGEGFTYSTVDLTAPSGAGFLTTNWYHIEITTISNNIKIEVFDINNNLIDSQTNAYTPLNDNDRIILKNYYSSVGNAKGYFDNILLSSVSPSTDSGINWDLDQYTEGETASYSWTLENALWQDLLYKYRIQILKDGLEIDTVSVSQTGIGFQDVDTAGTYEVKLQYSGLWPTNWESIDSDSVNVIPEIDSYINVPKTAPQRTNFTVTYLYGSTPSNGLILMNQLDETTGIYETVGFELLDGDKQGGTTYSRNISLHSTGTYKITLVHDEQVDEIYDIIEITSLYVPPIETVGNSSINSDKSIYAIGETIFTQYTVDYTNFTTYNVNMEIYNIDKDIISYSIPTIDQISYISQTIPITNEFFSGNHHLRLTSYDNTGSKVNVLASKNITIGLVNDAGFGLSLSKYDVMQLELFVIKIIAPTTSNIRVWSVERDTQAGSLITINGSTYLNYAIPLAGNYEITLSSGGLEIAKQYITVHEGFVDDPLIDEDEIIPDITLQDNTNNLLNSPYLIGLLIMAVFLAVGSTSGIGGMIVTGSMGLGITCYMGIFPWILLIIEVLVVAALFSKGLIDLSGD